MTLKIMQKKESVFPKSYTISEVDKDQLAIHFHGSIDIESTSAILYDLQAIILSKSPKLVSIILDNVSYFDEYGSLVLFKLKKLIAAQKGNLTISDKKNKERIDIVLKDFDNLEKEGGIKKRKSEKFFIRIGDATIGHFDNMRYFISFLGSVILSFVYVLKRPKSIRMNDTITCMEKTGVNAVPIVALISFLLGLVMAFMSSLQLKQFGANLYVASLVSIAMVSELGPIMTAIIVAGRSGSAFAAEIGTMKISEEVDALFIMGFNPTTFLAVPRILAAMIVVPILTLFSDLFAIAGGLVIGILALDLTFNSYIAQTLKTLTLFEVLWGLSKSMIFAVIIAWIGCLRGFQTRGGADAVGNSATSAVVTSIFLIILFDSFFAVARSYLW
jgi:phospholipid/cholesterol/gamma-HCH transport system permease protein